MLAAVAITGFRDHGGAAHRSGLEGRRLSAEEAPCAAAKPGVDFTTRKQLASIAGVLSASACRAHCDALPRCSAWTWGKAPGVSGVSHFCFPKVLAQGEQPKESPNPGVVSGMRCRAPAAAGGQLRGPARQECGQLEDVDFATHAELPPLNGVTSAEICQAACRAAPGCKAWSWGKARNSPGLTDRCFLKKLANGETPRHVPKKGVTSGFVCAPNRAAGGAAVAASSAATTAPPRPGMLYCFTLALPYGKEPALLGMQHQQQVGLFACDSFTVYSNMSFSNDSGIEVSIVPVSLDCGSRGELKAPMNLGIFREVWKEVLKDGTFWLYDWTVKVDPDTVFFPSRLRPVLHGYKKEIEVHQHGLYLNNCRFGLHGALEVFSSAAVQALADGWQRCEEHFRRLCSGDCRWGEDIFVDQCMSEVLLIRREYNKGLLIDESCGPPKNWQSCQEEVIAFHPFASSRKFMNCLNGVGQAGHSLFFK